MIYPYQLEPVVKDKIWGGRNLHTVLGKSLPPGAPVGETWEAWEGCRIANGSAQGQTLAQVAERDPAGVLGAASARFPLLFKFIDAQDDLSVQVHPDDAQAQVMEHYPFGKTEAWYILHAAPGARLILGFNRAARPEEIAASVRDNTLVRLMAEVPVQPGDALFVPAGTVHAIGRGIVLAEIQENSDITYRLYDWGRKAEGRALHIDQSLKVLNYASVSDPKIPPLAIRHDYGEQVFRVACRYFCLEQLDLRSRTEPMPMGRKFQIVTTVQGDAEILYGDGLGQSVVARRGQTFLLPAALGEYGIVPRPKCRMLRMAIPDLGRDVVQPLKTAGYDRQSIERLGGAVPEHNDLRNYV
jgi:mannose-6-phosphate isomerase